MMQYYQSHRARLIVTADDFGISPRANRNILYLAELGKINRVAVMVHGNMTDKELDQLNRSGVKIDIHLDILHEFDQQRKNRSGAISRGFEFMLKLLTGKISPSKVQNDWENQIKLFKKIFKRSPDGINSHEHVHLFPPFFAVALRLGKKYEIPYIRFGDSIFLRHNLIISHILHYLRRYNLKAFKKSASVSSSSLVSMDWIENVDDFLDNLPDGTIEIAAHPEVAEDFVKIKKFF